MKHLLLILYFTVSMGSRADSDIETLFLQAVAGEKHAQRGLAHRYLSPSLGNRNVLAALIWIDRAARDGETPFENDAVALRSKFLNSSIYFSIRFVSSLPKRETASSIRHLEKLSAKNSDAALELSAYYGDQRDLRKQVEYLQLAVSLGNPLAMERLGYFYLLAIGVRGDASKAADLIQRSERTGNPRIEQVRKNLDPRERVRRRLEHLREEMRKTTDQREA